MVFILSFSGQGHEVILFCLFLTGGQSNYVLSLYDDYWIVEIYKFISSFNVNFLFLFNLFFTASIYLTCISNLS
jgi:hypothetical protein